MVRTVPDPALWFDNAFRYLIPRTREPEDAGREPCVDGKVVTGYSITP